VLRTTASQPPDVGFYLAGLGRTRGRRARRSVRKPLSLSLRYLQPLLPMHGSWLFFLPCPPGMNLQAKQKKKSKFKSASRAIKAKPSGFRHFFILINFLR
jgi:hypothetical protein